MLKNIKDKKTLGLREIIIGLNIILIIIGVMISPRIMSRFLGYYYFNRALIEMGTAEEEWNDKAGIPFLIISAQIDPGSIANKKLGSIYFYEFSDYENAILALTAYLETRPNDLFSLELLGDSYVALGKNDLGIIQYEKILVREFYNVDIRKKLSSAYQGMGEWQKEFSTLYWLIKTTFDDDREFSVRVQWLKELNLSSESFSREWLEEFNLFRIPVSEDEKLSILTRMDELRDKVANEVDFSPGIPLGFGRQASAVIDSDNTLYVLAQGATLQDLLFLSSSNDNGQTWKNEKILYIGESANLDGDLAIDSAGVIHVHFGTKGGTSYYANSKTNFSPLILVADKADGRQLAIDDGGVVHLIWADTGQIWHSAVSNDQSSSEIESVASGSFPALSVYKSKLFISYNESFAFPDSRGAVWFIEKETASDWSEPVKLSADNLWAGASDITISTTGEVYVVFIEDADIAPRLVVASRDTNRVWNTIYFDASYPPYIAFGTGLFFGGRTSPSIKAFDDAIYVLWRAERLDSPILISKLTKEVQKFENLKTIGYLYAAPYYHGPSFVSFQESFGIPYVLWVRDGKPTIHR